MLRTQFQPVCTILAMAACFTTTAFGELPSFIGLEDLPGGTSASFGWAVSGDGSVVVGESQSADGNQAFR